MNVPEYALSFHQQHPVLIAHMDLPAELHLRRQAGQAQWLQNHYLLRLRQAGIQAVIGAIFVHPAYLPEMALSAALEQAISLLQEIEESGSQFCLVRNSMQLDRALDAGQIAVLLSLEGSEPLGRSPALLRVFYELGARLLGLTWNGRTMAADGCALPGGGLTADGRELVQAAWELGMILDVSHLNDAGFEDLLSLGEGPVIASHSNCRVLCDHPRNLTDDQILRLARRGGVIGINQVRFLARQPGSAGTLEDLCDHIQRIERIAGPGHTGLGLDFARGYMEALPKPKDFWQSWNPLEEDILDGYDALPQVTAMLLERGVVGSEVAGILGGNFLQFLRKALREK